MTAPAGPSGAVDTTPDTGGAVGYAASGYGGADREDAPDVRQGAMHVPGEAPANFVLDGPAQMPVGGNRKRSAQRAEAPREAKPSSPKPNLDK